MTIGLCAPDAPNRELLVQELVVDCMKHWPKHVLESRTAFFHLWCELMVLPATWIDFAFLFASSDCFSVVIAATGVDDRGNVLPVSLLEPVRGLPIAWLEVGMWFNRHMVAIVHAIDVPSPAVGDGSTSRLDVDGAVAEWTSFDWPLRSVQYFKRLSRCSHM